jgi:endo-1,4-beta-D-glucanase Y
LLISLPGKRDWAMGNNQRGKNHLMRISTGKLLSSKQLPTKHLLLVFVLILGVLVSIAVTRVRTSSTSASNRPFPQNRNYQGAIKPNHLSQAELNSSIQTYYEYWKNKYVKTSNGVTPGGGYYVFTRGTGGTGNEITTSEAHGYGMIIFALLAGYDSQAKERFDGMFNMFDQHRSKDDPDNMSWLIDKSESTANRAGNATDGDMDIAYALLLAHQQWGSDGKINYLAQAKRAISNGIKESEICLSTRRTLLGSWSTDHYASRTSDWIVSHFKAYREVTGDAFWDDATNTTYGLIKQVTNDFSSGTFLLPDFVVGSPAQPARPKFLESEHDGYYSWNACRVPWRLATDFAHYGSPQSREALNKMLIWLKDDTSGNPSYIKAGYKLDGRALVDYGSVAFTAPFIAGCIVDSSHQKYLNAGWDLIKNWRESYFEDTVNLLCMLLISGNWWSPTA